MKNKTIVIILSVIFMVVIVSFGIRYIFQALTENALTPIRETNNFLRTQVAQVLHPTPTVIADPVTIINDVRSLARLETIQYSVEKIITAETGQESFAKLLGDRILFVAHGVVIAGIDLNQLEISDMELRDGILTMQLPEAEIFIATLDNDKSYIYERDTGLLKKADKDLETVARQSAEDAIEEAALEDGILELARFNAEVFLERLLNDLGFSEVLFE